MTTVTELWKSLGEEDGRTMPEGQPFHLRYLADAVIKSNIYTVYTTELLRKKDLAQQSSSVSLANVLSADVFSYNLTAQCIEKRMLTFSF